MNPGTAARFDLVEALKEINRHIEALETIGGYGVSSSVISARDERIEIVRTLTLLPPNRWICTTIELPEDETDVLLATSSGEVLAGFHLGGQWRHLTADPIHDLVTHWAHFPPHPSPSVSSVSSVVNPSLP